MKTKRKSRVARLKGKPQNQDDFIIQTKHIGIFFTFLSGLLTFTQYHLIHFI